MFFKKEMFQSIGPPLLSWTYWWVSCAEKKKKSSIGFLFCSVSVSSPQGRVNAGQPQWLKPPLQPRMEASELGRSMSSEAKDRENKTENWHSKLQLVLMPTSCNQRPEKFISLIS